MKQDIFELLRGNAYPGRGIIIGASGDGLRSVILYFIMGRSENSRNRVFEKTSDGIRTAAFDITKMTDPSLIIYHPVRRLKGITIVTNGDQTDTVSDFLTRPGATRRPLDTFYVALQTREFEPDAPNFTPRISGIVPPDGSYTLSVLKTVEGDPSKCLRCFFEYPWASPGLGHFVSTYKQDGDPLPSFEGEPIAIDLSGCDDFEAFVDEVWYCLNDENKVSLYACERSIATGETTEMIINKHK